MGLFGKKNKKLGIVFMDLFTNTYLDSVRRLSGSSPSPEELAEAHLEALDVAQEVTSQAGCYMDKDSIDKEWLEKTAQRMGVNVDDTLRWRLEIKYGEPRETKRRQFANSDTPTSRKLVLTEDGRGVLIHGRDPKNPDTTSWTYQADPGIDFFAVEAIVQKEANHMDVDLGLPISWTLWRDDAEEYAKSPEEYKKKREERSGF
jgi:hypothetical protein